jgi:hypothetical protein
MFIQAIQMPELKAQCNIQSKLYADGTMYYFIEPLVFYQTNEQKLQGGVGTDKENYFIMLYPYPFPPRPDGLKLKTDASITLSNQKTYTLSYYDAQYSPQDSVLKMLYMIDKKNIDDLSQFDVDHIIINMGKEGERIYNFRLHKAAIHEQLKCLSGGN